ncbi:MAG: hypothetical protein LBI42_04390 [Chitinispirillales bacterium]|jgi:hypothetical protein|nr:hypothetical protein [Chitinispirillales bacterium]
MVVVLIIATFFVTFLHAADEAVNPAWQLSAEACITSTFNSFTENWDRSESGSFLWAARSTNIAVKQLSRRLYHENSLKIAFGQTKLQDKETKKWSSPQKSTDLIDFETSLKFKLEDFSLKPFLSLRAVSQFYDTRDPDNCRYANPATFTKSFGLAKYLLKNPDISWQVRWGGALRCNIDRDAMPYEYTGEEWIKLDRRETSVITDAGTELVTEFKMKRGGAGSIAGKLTVFEALARPADLQTAGWRYPDVSLETIVNINITRHLIFNYMVQFIFDRETDPDPKIRQAFSAGLSVSLKNEHFTKGKEK